MKILVLYSEMAGYFLACMEKHAEVFGGEFHVIRWKVNDEAPFEFGSSKGIHWYERDAHDPASMIALGEKLQPDLIYVTGWIDKGYLKVAAHFKSKGLPVIAAFDTKWRGDLKQRIATFISPLVFKRRFSHLWVSGIHQYEYARRLGFARNRILTGMYSADTPRFEALQAQNQASKAQAFPQTLLFVGRFVEMKRVLELCQAFIGSKQRLGHNWKLRLVGRGPLKDQIPHHPDIELMDFVQPNELPGLAADAGAFVLSSFDEPWGVVLHEFAAAGLPLVACEGCGASTAFVRNGYNGFLVNENSTQGLQAALEALFQSTTQELLQMGERSLALSRQISPDTWAATLQSIAKGEL